MTEGEKTMKCKNLKLPAIIIAIGLVLAVAASLFTNIVLTPTVAEHDFDYSVTYKLNGETKTYEGVYTCRFDGYSEGENPADRYYTGEYTADGQTTLSHTYPIAEQDGAELYIVTLFNDCYLMGDKKDDDYRAFLEAPYLEAIDHEGYEHADMIDALGAEIISWEYPEPIENTFVFSGFSILHAGSMFAMLLVGLLVIIACIIFVRRDKTVPYKVLDKLSIVLNCVICFAAIPVITFITAMMQIVVSGDELMYQVFLCIPALTAFALAASIALRRKGFTQAGFFVQFAGPVLYFVPMVVESVFYTFF